jgi:hypothetical protein
MRRVMAMALTLMLILPGVARAAAVLDVGSTGADVRKVQQKLIDWAISTEPPTANSARRPRRR